MERGRAGIAAPRQSTTLGSLGDHHHVTVDPRGLVTPWPGGWSLDWWVGAADRWHLPSREPAVSQALIEGTPVTETVMRVPRGDVALRVYTVPGLAVAEAENRSDTPVAVAFAVRPYNAAGVARVERIEAEGTGVLVDGRPALWLPRAPSAAASSTGPDGDCVHRVTASGATGGWPLPAAVDRHGMAQAAFVYPLPHTRTIRVALPLGPGASRRRRWPGRDRFPVGVVDPSRLPSAADVVKGWQAQLGHGLHLALPDAALVAAVEANRAYAVLFGESGSTPAVRDALGRFGLGPRGDVTDAGVPDAQEGREPFDPVAAWRRVRQLLGSASSTYTWPASGSGHDPGTAAEFLSLVRTLAVREGPGAEPSLALCSLYPPEWTGLPFEVHGAPTRHGLISYALRWHGDRPALLWECERPGVRLVAPGLDRSWSTVQRTGEALLAPYRGRVGIPLADPD